MTNKGATEAMRVLGLEALTQIENELFYTYRTIASGKVMLERKRGSTTLEKSIPAGS